MRIVPIHSARKGEIEEKSKQAEHRALDGSAAVQGRLAKAQTMACPEEQEHGWEEKKGNRRHKVHNHHSTISANQPGKSCVQSHSEPTPVLS